MKLKLPEPLPYDFVDEWIDMRLKFYSRPHQDSNLTYHRAVPRNSKDINSGNYGRHVFELIDDWTVEDSDRWEEDEYGYWNYPNLFSYHYTAREWSEDAIDEFLGLGRYAILD